MRSLFLLTRKILHSYNLLFQTMLVFVMLAKIAFFFAYFACDSALTSTVYYFVWTHYMIATHLWIVARFVDTKLIFFYSISVVVFHFTLEKREKKLIFEFSRSCFLLYFSFSFINCTQHNLENEFYNTLQKTQIFSNEKRWNFFLNSYTLVCRGMIS